MCEEEQLYSLHVHTSHHVMQLAAYMPFMYQAFLQFFTALILYECEK